MTIGLCLSSPQFVFVGFMIGAVLFGIVADVYGRKRVSDKHTTSGAQGSMLHHASFTQSLSPVQLI